jgi:hypothetical protein
LLYSCRCNRPASRLLRNSLLIILLAGCVPPPVVRHENAGANEITADDYLALLYRFNNADAARRTFLYERIATDAVLQPTAPHRLQLALLKAWPGHPGYNPEAAQELLQSALLQDSKLTPGAENLARVYLLIMNQQLQASNHSRALATELEEARAKLEALTTIERTVETPTPRADATP